MEAKNFIIDLVKEGKHFYTVDNVFHGEKMFVVYSVVRWVVSNAKEGNFDNSQVKNYLNAISAYLNNEIELFWERGVIYVSKKKESKKEREHNA